MVDMASIYDQPDFEKLVMMSEIDALRHNIDYNIILIRAFHGGWDANQVGILQKAIARIIQKYGPLGFQVIYEKYNNLKKYKYKYKFNRMIVYYSKKNSILR